MFGKTPDVSLFRVFGCLAYVHVKKDKRTGFSPHMEKAIFVGYPDQFKGWEFFNPFTKQFVLSDRADFDERFFPGLSTRLPDPPPFPPLNLTKDPSQSTPNLVIPSDDDSDNSGGSQMCQQVGDVVGDADSSSDSQHNSIQHPSPPASPVPHRHNSPPPPVIHQPPVRCSTRAKVPPAQWQQNWYKGNYRSADHRLPPPQYRDPPPQIPSSDEGESDPSQSGSDSEESELIASEFTYLTLPEALEYAFKSGSHDDSPRSYAQAMTCTDAQMYHEATCDEIQSLLDNGTWELAQLPPG